MSAVARTLRAKAAGGRLELDFRPRGGPAIVLAIDVATAAPSGAQR